ncbi:MAG: ABC transporter permease [Alphaproteobacteria bacterium]
MIKLEARPEIANSMIYGAPLLAVALTLIAGMMLFNILGVNALEALRIFFIDPVTSKRGIAELFLKATPLILIGVGLSFGFRAGVWNIGAEGQFIIGGLAGGSVALLFYEVDSIFVLPLMLIAGTAGGMLWACLPAFFKTRFNANEILTSLMLVYVANLLLSLLIHGPLKDPDGYSFPESRLFHDAALIPTLLGTRLHYGAFAALIIVGVAWLILSKHIAGFHFKTIGQAPRAAAFAGVNPKKIVWASFMISGAGAGLAGIFEVAGPIGQIVPSISPGYGFTAIIVAFLGRLHPVGILLAGLVLALSFLGGEAAQVQLNMPNAVTGIFQGMLLFFLLAADVLVKYRFVFK